MINPILSLLKPFLIFKFVMNTLPFKLIFGKTTIILKYNKKIFFCNIFVYWFINVSYYYISSKTFRTHHFKDRLQRISHSSYVASCFITTWLLYWINLILVKSFDKTVSSFIQLSEKFERLNIKINYKKLNKVILFWTLLEGVITLSYAVAFITVRMSGINTSVCQLIIINLHFMYTHLQLLEISYSFNLGYFTIKEFFLNIRYCLESIQNPDKTYFIKLGKLHAETCEFTRKYNGYISWKLFVIFGSYFIVFTSNLVYVATTILWREITDYVLVSVFWICFCAIKVYLWIHLSSSCMNEVIIFL